MKMTRTLKKLIENWGLKFIHSGLPAGYKNARYTDENNADGLLFWDRIDPVKYKNYFVAEFHYYSYEDCSWYSYEKTNMSYEEMKTLCEDMKNRRIWNARQYYYEEPNTPRVRVVAL